jgi:hypothetical protein
MQKMKKFSTYEIEIHTRNLKLHNTIKIASAYGVWNETKVLNKLPCDVTSKVFVPAC